MKRVYLHLLQAVRLGQLIFFLLIIVIIVTVRANCRPFACVRNNLNNSFMWSSHLIIIFRHIIISRAIRLKWIYQLFNLKEKEKENKYIYKNELNTFHIDSLDFIKFNKMQPVHLLLAP